MKLIKSNKVLEFLYKNPQIFFIFFSFFIFLEYFIFGHFSFLKIHDHADSHLPRYIWLSNKIINEGITYFFPQFASGVDVLSNGPKFFDIVTIVHILLPNWFAANFIFILQVFIASYFCFTLAKNHLKLSTVSSYISGMIWGIFQYQQLDYALGIASIPLLIILILKLLKLNGYIFFTLSFVVGFLYSIICPITILVLTIPVIFLWFLIIEKNITFKFSLILAMILLIVFLVQFQFIFALLDIVRDSHRYNRVPNNDFLNSLKILLDWSIYNFPSLIIYACAKIFNKKSLII